MLLLLISLFVVSCGKETPLSIVEKEIGKPISVEEFGLNETQYHWNNIPTLKQSVLKNSLDKIIGALPKTDRGLEVTKSGGAYQVFVWETTEIMVELDCYFSKSMEKMNVRLIVVPK